MKSLTLMIVSFITGLVLCSASYAQSQELVDKYWRIANKLAKEGKYLEAAKTLEKAAEAEKRSPRPRLGKLAMALNITGYCYHMISQYPKAIEYYEKGLAIERKLGRQADIAIGLNNIGLVYKAWSQYDKAITYYEKALTINKKIGRDDQIAIQLNNLGEVYRARGQNDKAITYYEKALAINRKLRKEAQVAIQLNNIGMVYEAWGQYNKALTYYEKALAISRMLGRPAAVAIGLNNIGAVYRAWGQYEEAITYFEKALAIDRKLGSQADIATDLNNIGMVHKAWGQYEKAITYYKEALAINKNLGKDDQIAIQLNNIGMVYEAWGQYDRAIAYYEKSLGIDKKLGKQADIATDLNNIGEVYRAWGQYEKAITYYEKSLAISKKLGSQAGIAIGLNNIGSVYGALGQNDKAITYFEEALAISTKLEMEDQIATRLNNIGLVYQAWGQHDKAITYYKEALAIDRKLGRQADIATDLNNIGTVYYAQKIHDKAIKHFEASVDLKEKIRKTATGDVRRDYLASQIDTYLFLISTFVRTGNLHKAFTTIELSRAKLLAERLAESESNILIPSPGQIQKILPQDTAILIYSNVGTRFGIVLIVLTKDNIYGVELPDDRFIASALEKYETYIRTALERQQGFTAAEQGKRKLYFDDVITYYRNLLRHPSFMAKRGAEVVNDGDVAGENEGLGLSAMLYDFLIKPLGKHIKDKKTLIIVPDGILGYLPFETLADQNGKYLIENYDIRYAQSLGVLDLIKKRKYAASRNPMLAFGGAVYDEASYGAEMIGNDRQLQNLQKKVYAALEKRGSVRDAYAKLDLGRWQNLPGTLSEVNNIKKAVAGTKAFIGKEATENEVKKLSQNGELASYKVIHFATHGLVVPAIPELSAVVLSQFKNENAGEDGYLCMGEIAKLDIKADFVNLSACETGLGKIYGGEGVVGLAQSFLIAGANGLSVSLWQVADISTSKFMVALYALVQKKGLSYDQAINEIKRRFIKGGFGDKYKAPFYWAPFVYYGI